MDRDKRLAHALAICDTLFRLQLMRQAQLGRSIAYLQGARSTAYAALESQDAGLTLQRLEATGERLRDAQAAHAAAKALTQECGRRQKLVERLYKEAAAHQRLSDAAKARRGVRVR